MLSEGSRMVQNGWKKGFDNQLFEALKPNNPSVNDEKALLLHLADNAVSGTSNRDGFASNTELSALRDEVVKATKDSPL